MMPTKLIPLVVLLTLVAGCQDRSLGELTGEAQDVLDDARSRAQALGALSADELQELWAIEYRTLEIPHTDLAAIDEQLDALGQERWDCYHVSETDSGRVFYFKRPKSTALSHLTNLLRLGSIAF